ncbi:FkbM family methyltransferase [Catenibacterium mitsuokai]|uniref:FkbM family methyltransferase n=1 Tax=Catenibacterium mitsuokai TaxID=100886 RepID=UPI003F9329DF
MLIEKLRNRLVDEKSKIFFDARYNYKTDKRLTVFYNNIKDAKDKYEFREVDEFLKSQLITEFYIVGSDDSSVYSYHILKDYGYSVIGLITDNKLPNQPKDIHCYSWDNVKDTQGIIVFQRYYDQIPQEILSYAKILVLYDHVVGRTGKQYFDFFSPNKREYFLDAGCLDGRTTKDFIDWCNGNYGAVYAFEANPLVIPKCKQEMTKTVQRNKLHFFSIALWNKNEQVKFDNSESKWNAHVADNGSVLIQANTVDSLLTNKKVTYFKLDIEGSELNAIYGARNCIIHNHPRMAISVYHNDNDLFDIMKVLIEMQSDYKFAIRHYHSDAIETILYAF